MPRTEESGFLRKVEELLNEVMGYPEGTLALKGLCDAHGGGWHYIPSSTERYMDLRNSRIRDKFDGCNHEELSAEFGLSVKQIRRILKQKE